MKLMIQPILKRSEKLLLSQKDLHWASNTSGIPSIKLYDYLLDLFFSDLEIEIAF